MLEYAVLLFTVGSLCDGFREIDTLKYEEGKQQYAVVDKNTNMPKFGQCWTNTVQYLQTGCKDVTDEMQTRMALAYLNCFLLTQGREPYSCGTKDSIQTCTKYLTESDRSSLVTFFTHTHNICYFLQAQIWHENTENSITRLSTRSDEVATKLEKSSQLQQEIMEQQNVSLINQKHILSQAENLSSFINESTSNIHELFIEYQKTTSEQRLLINDIFDRVSQIQSTIITELAGFNSFLIYTLAIIMCYLLTSTSRTNSARFPLFGIVSMNFFIEKGIYSWISESTANLTRAEEADQNNRIYEYQWLCREIACVFGLVTIIMSAYRYMDINTINHQLLMEIKKQNMELKTVLEDQKRNRRQRSLDDKQIATIPNHTNGFDSTGSETGSNTDEEQDDCSYHSNTNIDMIMQNMTSNIYEESLQSLVTHQDVDTCSESSFSTAISGSIKLNEKSELFTRSASRSSEFKRNLGNLPDVPSFTKLKENILNWTSSGCYVTANKDQCEADRDQNNTTTEDLSQDRLSKMDTPAIKRYNLQRRNPRTFQ